MGLTVTLPGCEMCTEGSYRYCCQCYVRRNDPSVYDPLAGACETRDIALIRLMREMCARVDELDRCAVRSGRLYQVRWYVGPTFSASPVTIRERYVVAAASCLTRCLAI